jgi:hypothetical protein
MSAHPSAPSLFIGNCNWPFRGASSRRWHAALLALHWAWLTGLGNRFRASRAGLGLRHPRAQNYRRDLGFGRFWRTSDKARFPRSKRRRSKAPPWSSDAMALPSLRPGAEHGNAMPPSTGANVRRASHHSHRGSSADKMASRCPRRSRANQNADGSCTQEHSRASDRHQPYCW